MTNSFHEYHSLNQLPLSIQIRILKTYHGMYSYYCFVLFIFVTSICMIYFQITNTYHLRLSYDFTPLIYLSNSDSEFVVCLNPLISARTNRTDALLGMLAPLMLVPILLNPLIIVWAVVWRFIWLYCAECLSTNLSLNILTSLVLFSVMVGKLLRVIQITRCTVSASHAFQRLLTMSTTPPMNHSMRTTLMEKVFCCFPAMDLRMSLLQASLLLSIILHC
jgi:hypothetical protein